MCLKCGPTPAVHWSERLFLTAADDGDLRRRRARHTRLLDEVAGHCGLRVRNPPGSTGYAVSDRKGTSRVVDGPGDVWLAIDALSSRCVDPLDPVLLDGIEADGAP